MKVLIVFAHPEPKSFNAALLQCSLSSLQSSGHEVQVSNLYKMGFNPVAGSQDFSARRFPGALQYDREQKYAYQDGSFSADIRNEIDKLLWCDFLILQFPLWWFSVPAILKGWIDRVFVNGVVYGNGRRFDNGGLKGKKAMLTVSTACYPEMVAPDGLLADLNISLWHLNYGTLAYAGLKVLPPFVSWSIHYTTDQMRNQYLTDYSERMTQLEVIEPLYFHPLSDFGEDWRLKEGIEPRTVAHRRSNPGR
jgi:NAD(P)H dehydrogenase (quinone)